MAVSTTHALFDSGLTYRREEDGKCVVVHDHPPSSKIKNLDISGIREALNGVYSCNAQLKRVVFCASKDGKLSAAISEALKEHEVALIALKSKLFDEQFKNGAAPTRWICS